MDTREQKILQKNHTLLVNDLSLDSIARYLYENSVLTRDDMEILTMQNSTRTKKNETFLVHILPGRGPDAYKEFLNALREDDCYHYIIKALENTPVSEEDLQKPPYTAGQDLPQDVQSDGAVLLSEVSLGRRHIERGQFVDIYFLMGLLY